MNNKIKASIGAAAVTIASGLYYLTTQADQCQIKAFVDYSSVSPAQPNAPNYKWVKPMSWGGNDYVVMSNGWSIEIFRNRHLISSSSRVVCQPPLGCPGYLPGDYDWPLERFAICDDAKYAILNGKYGIGGTIIVEISNNNGRPRFSAKGIIEHNERDIGAFTWVSNGEQYMISTLPSPCGTTFSRIPSIWHIDSYDSISFIRCLGSEAYTVNGGLLVGNYLYLTAKNQTVRAYTWPELVYCGVMPIQTLFSDGAGIDLRGNLLAVSRLASVQLWDASDPLAPVVLSELQGHSVSAFMGGGLWTGPRASSQPSKMWCLSDPAYPTLLLEIPVAYDNQKWEAACQGVIAAGQVVLWVDPECYECDVFADGFESGGVDKWSEVKP